MSGCAHCGGPLAAPERSHARSDNSGTRIARAVWLAHLEVDPYCSADCCRAAHGATIPDAVTGRCQDCQRPFAKSRNTNAGPYCAECSRKERQRRYFFEDGVCAHCGIDKASYTTGCWTCGDRRRKRAADSRRKVAA